MLSFTAFESIRSMKLFQVLKIPSMLEPWNSKLYLSSCAEFCPDLITLTPELPLCLFRRCTCRNKYNIYTLITLQIVKKSKTLSGTRGSLLKETSNRSETELYKEVTNRKSKKKHFFLTSSACINTENPFHCRNADDRHLILTYDIIPAFLWVWKLAWLIPSII